MKTKRKWGRLSGTLLCGTILAGLLSMTAFAQETSVAINETNFPDENFREIVKSYDIDGDNTLSSTEIEEVTEINCSSKGISSLKGIEYFTVLAYLNCSSNRLSSLDVSQNTALWSLYCSNNWLSSLDVSQNTALAYLCCSDNQLSSLDVSQNTALQELWCYQNQLSSLDVSQNTELWYLWCSNNQLSSLDVSKNTALRSLYCDHNQLSSLDVSENIALEEFDCGGNQLSNMDVSQNTALWRLYCSNNRLSSLDVSQNTALEELFCYNNQLTSLDVSENTALDLLSCQNNQYLIEVLEDRIFDLSTLPGFDVSKASNWRGGTVDGTLLHINTGKAIITYSYDCGNSHFEKFSLKLITPDVEINATNFPDENFREYVKSYDIDGNNVLSYSEIEDVTWIDCSGKGISSLKGIEYFIVLQTLDCFDNELSSLDLSQNAELGELYCSNNRLSSLDVSKNTALRDLVCYNNWLSSLDVSKNTVLEHLDCNNNRYFIEVPANRIFDLSTLPGFNVSKASNWQGGIVDGNQLQVNKGVEAVTYTYDCGKNYSETFTLEVKVLPHPCAFDQKDIVKEALKTPADCTHDAVYYRSCECGEISTSEEETFVAKRTALGHKYRTAWSSDKTNHWHECSRCHDKKDEAAHTLKTSVTPATLTKAGKAVTRCSVCEEVTKTKTIAAIKTVKLSKTSYVYDGKTKTPTLIVNDSAGNTIASKYYKVEKSSGRKNVGKYTYKITFKGNYKGTKTLCFGINPKGTELISLQAESKGFTARWKKQATQTTGYEIRYATNAKMDGAKTVKITKNSKVSQKITKLSAKKKYYVQIRTYKKINTATYYSGWSKTKTVTTRK